MKIAILIPDLGAGGVERVRLLLGHEFKSRGHSVEFLLMRARGELLAEARAHFPVHPLNCERIRQLGSPLTRYLHEKRPDVMLVAMWPLTGLAGFITLCARTGTRVVVSEHNDFRMAPAITQYERLALRYFGTWLYAPCDRVIAVSQGVADGLAQVTGLGASKVEVIYNPVRPFAPSVLTPEDRRLLTGWLCGQVRLIAIGSLKPQKGFDVLLKAFATLRMRLNLDAQLLILGEGPLRATLERLAIDLGVNDNVWLPGFRANPATFLQHSDVFVLSSYWEGLGNVIIEALGAGLPVVSTDCRSGPSEILQNGKYGLLCPVGHAEALATAIVRSANEIHDHDALRRRSADFSVEKAAARYLAVMEP